MKTHLNSYEPCGDHVNGHTPQCLLCEIDALRGLPPLTLVKKYTNEHRAAKHMAARAQRYMEKRLLRDLWQAWRTYR